MNASRMGGFVLRFGKWHFRVWKTGYEWGNETEGSVRFFPWHPHVREQKRILKERDKFLKGFKSEITGVQKFCDKEIIFTKDKIFREL